MARTKFLNSAKRFSIHWVTLDPTVGHEVKKTRPCVIVSPDDINAFLKTVVIAPFTSQPKHYSSRVPCTFNQITGEIMLDQMRGVDKSRLGKAVGQLSDDVAKELLDTLAEMFAP